MRKNQYEKIINAYNKLIEAVKNAWEDEEFARRWDSGQDFAIPIDLEMYQILRPFLNSERKREYTVGSLNITMTDQIHCTVGMRSDESRYLIFQDQKEFMEVVWCIQEMVNYIWSQKNRIKAEDLYSE